MSEQLDIYRLDGDDFERFCPECGEDLEFCSCSDDDEGWWENVESEVAAIDREQEKSA